MKNLMKIYLFVLCFVLSGIYPVWASFQGETKPSPKTTSSTKPKPTSLGESENESRQKLTTQSTVNPKSTTRNPSSSPSDDKKNPESSTEKTTDKSDETTSNPTPTPRPTPQEKGLLDDVWKILTWLALAAVGLVGLGLVGYFVYYVLASIRREKNTNIQAFQKVRESQKQMGLEINELNKLVRIQNDRIGRQDKLIQSLQNQLKEENLSSYKVQTPIIEQPPIYKPEPQFPVSVENYLNKVRHQAQKASADTIGGLLIQDPSKNEEFMIIKDSALDNELFYAVPSFVRFQTKSEYLTYYQNYYNCENPSGGAVWIISPTIVRRVAEGWQLQQKGELEFK